MIKIKINKKTVYIKTVSELSFEEFNAIIAESESISLPAYLAYFSEMDEKTLLSSEFKGNSLTSLYQKIFNIDVKSTVLDKSRKTFTYKDKVYLLDDLRINTFGKAYSCEVAREAFRSGRFNNYEYCLYVLACGLSKDLRGDDIDDIFQDLVKSKWIHVLPAGFFLSKHIKQKRIERLLLSQGFIYQLKLISSKTRHYLNRLKKLEKKHLRLTSAENLI